MCQRWGGLGFGGRGGWFPGGGGGGAAPRPRGGPRPGPPPPPPPLGSLPSRNRFRTAKLSSSTRLGSSAMRASASSFCLKPWNAASSCALGIFRDSEHHAFRRVISGVVDAIEERCRATRSIGRIRPCIHPARRREMITIGTSSSRPTDAVLNLPTTVPSTTISVNCSPMTGLLFHLSSSPCLAAVTIFFEGTSGEGKFADVEQEFVAGVNAVGRDPVLAVFLDGLALIAAEEAIGVVPSGKFLLMS